METDKSLLLLLNDDNEDDVRHLNLRATSRSNKRSSNYNGACVWLNCIVQETNNFRANLIN